MNLEEMKAGIKGAITSLLFWLVLVYVPVVVVDVPALLGLDLDAMAPGDPARIGLLVFLWGALVVFFVFGLIAGVRGERQAAWAARHRRSDATAAEKEEKPVRHAGTG